MTTTDSTARPAAYDDSAAAPAVGFWDRMDLLLERGGELLNPILIKEARQSLKSRQFIATFTLVMICGWSWSVIGVSLLYPAIYYAPGGPFMMIGYFLVLAVPLLVIVPFSAFRSLAAEREDGTFELLSITSLTARQIITGKLGSAVLQMIVYYSALAPCIAFTYLLRGIDIVSIMFVLVWTFLASVMFCVVSLLLGAMTRSRQLHVLLTVMLIIMLLVTAVIWSMWMAFGVIASGGNVPFDDAEFWTANVCVLTFYISFFFIFLFAAAAHISFESDNRSTKIRVVMLLQQLLLAAWVMRYWLRFGEQEILLFLPIFAGIHWAVMAAFLSGETAPLSPRVLRSLPQSFLGRMTFTWFNPGSGTGYMFAMVNLASVIVLTLLAALCAHLLSFRGAPASYDIFWPCVMVLAYVVAYMGVARLLVLVMKRYLNLGLLIPVLISAMLVIAGAAVPTLLAYWMYGFNNPQFTSLQATNWYWTIVEAIDGGLWAEPLAPVTVMGFALIIFFVNLVVAAREVEFVRQEAPQRVVADEMELHPEKFARPRVAKSPWDEDETPAGEPAT